MFASPIPLADAEKIKNHTLVIVKDRLFQMACAALILLSVTIFNFQTDINGRLVLDYGSTALAIAVTLVTAAAVFVLWVFLNKSLKKKILGLDSDLIQMLIASLLHNLKAFLLLIPVYIVAGMILGLVLMPFGFTRAEGGAVKEVLSWILLLPLEVAVMSFLFAGNGYIFITDDSTRSVRRALHLARLLWKPALKVFIITHVFQSALNWAVSTLSAFTPEIFFRIISGLEMSVSFFILVLLNIYSANFIHENKFIDQVKAGEAA